MQVDRRERDAVPSSGGLRHVTLAVLLVAALVAAAFGSSLLSAGCGGADDGADAGETSSPSSGNGASDGSDDDASDADDGLAVVQSDEYGFSFKYDPEVLTEQDEVTSQAAGAESAYRAGFFDEQGTQSSGQYRDGFLLNVYRLNTVVDESMMPQFKEDLENTVLPLLVESMGPDTLVGELQAVDDSDVIGYYTDVVYVIDGIEFNARLYFLINGDIEYQLTFQAAKDRWADIEPAFRQVIETFEATPVERGD